MDFNPYYSVDCCKDHSDMLGHLSEFIGGHDFNQYKKIRIEFCATDTFTIIGYRNDDTLEKIEVHGKPFHVMECKKTYVR